VFHLFFPLIRIVEYPWSLFGAFLIAAGIVLNIFADQSFKKSGTIVKPFEESAALVTNGVFRISRHPMYLGMVLILLGISFSLGSLITFLVCLIFSILMQVRFIDAEEKMLEKKFGQAWIEYKHNVRRWI